MGLFFSSTSLNHDMWIQNDGYDGPNLNKKYSKKILFRDITYFVHAKSNAKSKMHSIKRILDLRCTMLFVSFYTHPHRPIFC